jgi:hypothetical protein
MGPRGNTVIERLLLRLPADCVEIHVRQPLPPGAPGGPRAGVLAFTRKQILEPGWNGPFCFAKIEVSDADAGSLARGGDADKVLKMLIEAAVLRLDVEIEKAGRG